MVFEFDGYGYTLSGLRRAGENIWRDNEGNAVYRQHSLGPSGELPFGALAYITLLSKREGKIFLISCYPAAVRKNNTLPDNVEVIGNWDSKTCYLPYEAQGTVCVCPAF